FDLATERGNRTQSGDNDAPFHESLLTAQRTCRPSTHCLRVPMHSSISTVFEHQYPPSGRAPRLLRCSGPGDARNSEKSQSGAITVRSYAWEVSINEIA